MDAMPKKKHHIRLSCQEREQLETILRKGKASAQRQRHARILLFADTDGPEGGWSDSQIARAAQTSIPTVERVRRVCVEHGGELFYAASPLFAIIRLIGFDSIAAASVPSLLNINGGYRRRTGARQDCAGQRRLGGCWCHRHTNSD